MHFSRRLSVMLAAVGLALVGFITYAFAAGVIHLGGGGWYTCQHDAHANVANGMDVRNNGGQPMCIGSPNWGDDFTVYHSSVTTAWADFPNIFTGCELDGSLPQLCTADHSTPLQVAAIRSDVSSVYYYYPQQGFRGNSAYDIWFNTGGGQPQGRDNGAEIMIWLGTRGLGSPVYYRKVEIDGIWWGYDTWRAGGGTATHWNYIRYWRLSNYTPKSSATLNLIPFFQDAEREGRLSSSWYLTGTEYGFEVCSGGKGLAVRQFSDSIAMWKPLGGLKHRPS